MSNPPVPDEARHVALYNALRAKLNALYERDQFDIHEAVLSFHDYLKKKYADARDRRLFHLISGSTLKDFYGELDFPKPDSVEDFINAQYHAVFLLKEPHAE